MKKLLQINASDQGVERLQKMINQMLEDPKSRVPFNLPDMLLMVMHNQEAIYDMLEEILDEVVRQRK